MAGFNTESGYFSIGSLDDSRYPTSPLAIGSNICDIINLKVVAEGEWFINCDDNRRIRLYKHDTTALITRVDIEFQVYEYPNWVRYCYAGSQSLELTGDYLTGFWLYKGITEPYKYYVGAQTPVVGVDFNISPYELVGDNNKTFEDWVILVDPEDPDKDPFEEGGFSTVGGGMGHWDMDSDMIDIPDLPVIGAQSSNLLTLYSPTSQQLGALNNYLWSDFWEIASFKKIVANPMDCIVSLLILPCTVPTSGTREIKVGSLSTGVTSNNASNQFIKVNCGNISVKEFSGSYLDYSPYTKAEIYLPYIGTKSINVDDIMDRVVNVTYHIDILTGSCLAFVSANGTVLYTFEGNCATALPLTSTDYSNLYKNLLTSVASGGALASGIATGNAGAIIGGAIGAGLSTANSVASMKPTIQRGGNVGGSSGLMGIQTPFITFNRPKQCLPESQNKFSGYPSFITVNLSSLKGYNEIYSIHLENISATDTEKRELESLLQGGVIF